MAVANATKGNCVLSVRVVNKKVEWHCSDPVAATPSVTAGPAGPNTTAASPSPSPGEGEAPSTDSLAADWMTASKCPETPDKSNSVQDALGRLWGYDAELQGPCAFRAEDGTSLQYSGYIQVRFDTSPACAGTPTSTNSMEDAQGACVLCTLHTALRQGPRNCSCTNTPVERVCCRSSASHPLPGRPYSSQGRVLGVVRAFRSPVGVGSETGGQLCLQGCIQRRAHLHPVALPSSC